MVNDIFKWKTFFGWERFGIQKYPKGVEYQKDFLLKIKVFLERNMPQGCDIKVKRLPRDVFLYVF